MLPFPSGYILRVRFRSIVCYVHDAGGIKSSGRCKYLDISQRLFLLKNTQLYRTSNKRVGIKISPFLAAGYATVARHCSCLLLRSPRRSIERCQRFSNLAAATLAQSGNFSREAKEGNCVAQLEIAGDRRKNGPRRRRRRGREGRSKSGERERNEDAAPRVFNPNPANPVFQLKERARRCSLV